MQKSGNILAIYSILQDMPNHLNVYIYAPYEARLYNCTHDLMMDEATARKMIKEVDTARTNYQRKYCPEVKSVFDHKDLMIDSSKFGIDGTVKLLAGIVRERWAKKAGIEKEQHCKNSWLFFFDCFVNSIDRMLHWMRLPVQMEPIHIYHLH